MTNQINKTASTVKNWLEGVNLPQNVLCLND